jgi:hypothetical protein
MKDIAQKKHATHNAALAVSGTLSTISGEWAIFRKISLDSDSFMLYIIT